jgi:DNA invertase Pin-like site-specific DNA recombinase
MNKITADHLARAAYVYVRQSSLEQVQHNQESQRRQYGLADRARDLGWTDVVVVDDDLAISGAGVRRPGFERLLAAICEGRIGAVLTVEVSRLARNGRDWHTLLEFCGLVNCLILDEDSVYDPRVANDRLVLGMKGTMSELELSLIRQRLTEAMKFKARRGELFARIVAGYCRPAHEDSIEKDPDRRVQEAIELVFKKFAELQSVRQVHRWLRREGITLPKAVYGPQGRHILWELPAYWNVHGILTNPTYAGAYSYGAVDAMRSARGRP